jgi:hypothetical protein
MRLEPIFDMDLDYEDGFFVIAPYGGTEGTGYGSNCRWSHLVHDE